MTTPTSRRERDINVTLFLLGLALVILALTIPTAAGPETGPTIHASASTTSAA